MDQVLLAILGFLSIYFLSSKDTKNLKYGFYLGLLAEPLWFYSAWIHQQYGILFLVLCYGVCHIRGLYNCYQREKEP